MTHDFYFKNKPLHGEVFDSSFVRNLNGFNREVGEWERQPCKEYLIVNRLMKTGKYKMWQLNEKTFEELKKLEDNI